MSFKQDFAPKPAALTPRPAAEARREKRLHIAIAVKVFADARALDSQTCCTYDISSSGARLVAPHGVKEVGQTIALQRLSRKAYFKVVWIGKPGTSREGQVGVEAVNPKNVIWENELTRRLKQVD